jgi:hypothetical protein
MGQGYGPPPCLSTDGFYLKSKRHFPDSNLSNNSTRSSKCLLGADVNPGLKNETRAIHSNGATRYSQG